MNVLIKYSFFRKINEFDLIEKCKKCNCFVKLNRMSIPEIEPIKYTFELIPKIEVTDEGLVMKEYVFEIIQSI